MRLQKLGKAEPGDKTMVDALAPPRRRWRSGAAAAVAAGVTGTAAAARARRDATPPDRAPRRASYVGEAARGVCDPGALTVALLFESAL